MGRELGVSARRAMRRAGVVTGTLVAWSLLCGFSGAGRFSQPIEAGASSAVLNQVRAVIRPLYALRGSLFQLRLELTASDPANAADAALFAPWLALDPADAGWAAQQIHGIRAAPTDKRGQLTQSLASTLGGLRERRQIQSDVELFTDGSLLPTLQTGREFATPGPALIAVLAAPASKERVTRRLETISSTIQSFAALPGEVEAVLTAARETGRQARRDGERAARGSLTGILNTSINVVGGVSFAQQVIADLDAIPGLISSILSESVQIGGTLSSIASDTASGLGDLPIGPLKSLGSGSMPSVELLSSLRGACEGQ